MLRYDAGVGHGLLAGADGAIEDRLDEQLEDIARDLALITITVWQLGVEVSRGFRRELNLGIDGLLAQCLYRAGISTQIDTMLGVDFVERDSEEQVVDVVAAEMGVAVGGLHFKNSVAELEDGDVECASAEIVDGNGSLFGAIESVGQRGGGGLVDQAQHFKAGHAARVFCGLALRIVEISWHGDDGLGDGQAKEPLRIALELPQNVGGNFGCGKAQFAELDAGNFTSFGVIGKMERKELELGFHFVETAAHHALNGVDDALRRLDKRLARAVADGDCGPAPFGGDGIERND